MATKYSSKVGTVGHLITAFKQFVKQNERYLLTRSFLSVETI